VKIFCDTSVLLAAAKSAQGASRALFDLSQGAGWTLQASAWVIDVVSLDRALVFPIPKDRPVLVTALAWADVLVTLDREDFLQLLGSSCYGMPILLPAEFLNRARAVGKLTTPELDV
jgi:predicted nucleic acid-binding protein